MAGRQSGEVRCVNELIVTAGGCEEEREEKEEVEEDQGKRSRKKICQGRRSREGGIVTARVSKGVTTMTTTTITTK
jgi:hypothetical protein